MNKRVRKKAEKRIRAKIHEALDHVLNINGVHSRKQSVSGELPTAFFSFDGHTSGVGFRIYANGWDPDSYSSDSMTSYIDDRFNTVDLLNEKLKEMEKFYVLQGNDRNAGRGTHCRRRTSI